MDTNEKQMEEDTNEYGKLDLNELSDSVRFMMVKQQIINESIIARIAALEGAVNVILKEMEKRYTED